MIVNIPGLRQQAWRAEAFYENMTRYARSIGCVVIQDEVVCDTEEKSRKLAKWYTENA